MANFAKRVYEMVEVPITAEPPAFEQGINISGFLGTIIEAPRFMRYGVNLFTIGDSLGSMAVNMAAAISTDYLPGGAVSSLPINVTSDFANKTVTIEATLYGFEFSPVSLPSWLILAEDILEVEPLPVFSIDNISIQQANSLDTNDNVRFNISTSDGVAPYQILLPVSKSAPIESDLWFDYDRLPAGSVNIAIQDDNGDIATAPLPTVDIWDIGSVNVIEGTSGATASVITNIFTGDISVNIEYSLDDINYQPIPNFTGLLPDNYTVYARDNVGGSRTDSFIVEGIPDENRPDPYIDIPKGNPFRFIEDGDPIVSNWDNTLFKELTLNSFGDAETRDYYQLISNSDVIITQINSSYRDLVVNYIDCDGDQTPIAVNMIVNNIGQEDKRDAVIKKFVSDNPDVDGRIFLYFAGGNTYTPNTSIPISTYDNTSKGLFKFAEQGVLFSISDSINYDGDYKPIGEFYDNVTGYYGIVFDAAYTDIYARTIKVQTLYNSKSYDVYEFELDGITIDKSGYIKVEASDIDPRYTDTSFTGEPICKIDNEDTVAIDYSHSSNTAGLDFTEGSIFRIRLKATFIDADNVEETTSFQSDYGQKVVQKSITKRIINLNTFTIPFYLSEKISIASGMSNLIINDVGVQKGEDVEQRSLFNERNPFVILNRNYQQNETVVVSEETGLVTETQKVIGSSVNVAIGDRN